MPEVVIVDEIGTQEEALACRSIAERGVQLVGTAHGQVLENLLKNPAMTDLVGGIQSVTLGAFPLWPVELAAAAAAAAASALGSVRACRSLSICASS